MTRKRPDDATPMNDLFADSALAPASSGAMPQSKAQKRFKQLVGKLEKLDREIAAWTRYVDDHRARLTLEFDPLLERYDCARLKILLGLDRALDSAVLTRSEERECTEILEGLLDQWCDELEGPDLEALLEKYLPEIDGIDDFGGFGEMQNPQFDAKMEAAFQKVAAEVFGFDPEELLNAQTGDDPWSTAHTQVPPRPRKKSAKAQQREAQEAQATLDAEAESRKLYRKLVSALHPDREQDEQRRQQKTELMQQVNRAFEASDLLTLLRVHQAHLGGSAADASADEQLERYNRSLQGQLRERELELNQLQFPFLRMLSPASRGGLDTALVDAEFTRELKSLKRDTKDMEKDAQLFSDPLAVKAWLRAQREGRRSSRRR